MNDAAELVAIAQIVKVRGLRGEVAANVLTDFPERFDVLETVQARTPQGRLLALELDAYRWHGERILLKFADYDTPETAQALVGCILGVPEAECVELEPEEYYDWQLVGCQVVTVDGATLGTVREVLHNGPNDILSVKREIAAPDYLIPFVAAICVEVSITQKLIRVDAPEGLLEM